jgi:eukaryotic-like serine/threonine-protein kinase
MAAQLKSGSTLGRYELLVRLGRGGMASVWVARERAPMSGQQRLVALKAMLPELAKHSEFRAMFLEEGQIVRSIDHAHVVKVHEVAEDRGILYMAMEWVEGDSLSAVIKEARQRRAIPAEMAVKIIADAAAGLHAAHELRGWDGHLRHVVHCDVSPHNILVGLDGRAKVVDFGVANAAVHSDVSAEHKIKGKFGYMSPEQARAEELDRRSDVFALGIVLFELLTGERLFRGENAAHSLELVKSGPIPDAAELNPRLSPRVANVVGRSLERSLERRFQTAREMSEALERALVEDRVVVSHASVGQLVRRVVGARIEAQRRALRDALSASDGVLAPGLVLDDAAQAARSSFPPNAPPAAPSEPPSSSSRSNTPRAQSLELSPSRAPSALPAFAALVGVAAAGAALWYVERPPTSALPREATSSQARTRDDSKPAPNEYTPEPGPWGLKVDALPLDKAQPSATDRRARASAEVDGTRDAPVEQGASPASAPSSSAHATGAASEQPLLAPATMLDPTPPPPPAAERAPLNRNAALTALSRAASSAASCRRDDGPTGVGTVSVTFSPEGPVSSVDVASPFAGTQVGRCVEALFRAVHVPPFSGNRATLNKSFRISD